MSIQDIKRLEEETNVILPNYYKDYLLNFPEELINNNFIQGESPHERYFLNDIDKLLHYNKSKDRIGFVFVIGTDSGGNPYVIRLDDHSIQSVFFWDYVTMLEETVEKNLPIIPETSDNYLYENSRYNLDAFKDYLIEIANDD
jgi:SMI1-KNR4 cell-wall